MKLAKLVGVGALALLMACSGEDDNNNNNENNNNNNTCTGTPFAQPAGTVAVNFTVDDTENKVYTDGQLKWKGSFTIDAASRKLTYAGDWAGGNGPYPALYDDGSWKCGGHEPENAVAGDHKLGVTVFATPPAAGEQEYGYGLENPLGWIWKGANGSFKVAAGATAAINADGMKIDKYGTSDLKLEIDTNALDSSTDGSTDWGDTTIVKVKGTPTSWSLITLADNGQKGDTASADKKFTFVLSEYVGAGKQIPFLGLLLTGSKAEFIFTFGATDKEYKTKAGLGEKVGIKAWVKAAGASTWTEATIGVLDSNKNTYVTAP